MPSVYEITTVPAATPVTIPDDEPTVATPTLPLVHVPPDGVLFNVVVRPAQTVNVPVTDVGNGLTVMVVAAIQPVVNV